MSRENPNEHLDAAMEAEAPVTPAKRPDEFIVQTKRVIESWDYPKKVVQKEYGPNEPARVANAKKEYEAVPDLAKAPVKTTKLVNGYIGPFRNRATAEQVAGGMCMMESVISAEVITVVDKDEAAQVDKQVPASEDVLRAMVANGEVPGVPADATVRVEGEPQAATPDAEGTVSKVTNLVAFPGTESPDDGIRPE